MTLTDRQRERRHEHLGASDIARAITGRLHHVVTEKLWPDTTPDLEDQAVVQLGDALEPALVAFAESELGDKLTRRNLERRINGTPILLHMDAIREASNEPVECKTHGLLGPMIDDWGEPGSADVPLYAYSQAQLAMYALQSAEPAPAVAHVAVWLRRGRAMYVVPYNADTAFSLVEYGCRVWEEFILQRRIPDLDWRGWADLNARLARLPRYNGWVVKADKNDVKAVRQWESLKTARNVLDALCDAGRAQLLHRLEKREADALDLGDGTALLARQTTVNYKAREAYQAQRLDLRIVSTDKLSLTPQNKEDFRALESPV